MENQPLHAEQLTIGQEVYVVSGPYGGKTKVSKITPSGIETEDGSHFDLKGRGVRRECSEAGEWFIVDEETFKSLGGMVMGKRTLR
jgi:hypothetical protein